MKKTFSLLLILITTVTFAESGSGSGMGNGLTEGSEDCLGSSARSEGSGSGMGNGGNLIELAFASAAIVAIEGLHIQLTENEIKLIVANIRRIPIASMVKEKEFVGVDVSDIEDLDFDKYKAARRYVPLLQVGEPLREKLKGLLANNSGVLASTLFDNEISITNRREMRNLFDEKILTSTGLKCMRYAKLKPAQAYQVKKMLIRIRASFDEEGYMEHTDGNGNIVKKDSVTFSEPGGYIAHVHNKSELMAPTSVMAGHFLHEVLTTHEIGEESTGRYTHSSMFVTCIEVDGAI